jgi:guanylate kinase
VGQSEDEFREMQFVVLSGPSGSGKTTIVGRLLVTSPVKLVNSISATTRAPRKNEKDGVDYYFLGREDFAAKRERGEFLECAEVHSSGNWYGTLKSEVRRARDLGGWALLEIDVQGAMRVMQDHPNALTIFLKTSTESEFERRLRSRATESEDVIQRRLETARKELQFAPRYKFQVTNDDLDRAVKDITRIIQQWETKSHA